MSLRWCIYYEFNSKPNLRYWNWLFSNSIKIKSYLNSTDIAEMDYVELVFGAEVILYWGSPSISKQTIPSSAYFYPQYVGGNPFFWGDGKRLGTESWDDGNSSSGDGCSSSWTIESGYTWH